MSSPTTACFSIITWNKAYAIFAKETLLDKKAYMMKKVESNRSIHDGTLHNLYRRGWCLDDVTREEARRNTSIVPIRRIGDSHTWQIQLPTQDMVPSECPDSALECCFFRIEGARDSSRFVNRSEIRQYTIAARIISHIALKYTYIIADDTPRSWVDHVLQTLCRNAMFDFFAMKPSDRPSWFQRDLVSSGRAFTLYDHENVRDFKRPDYLRGRDDYMISMLKQRHGPGS